CICVCSHIKLCSYFCLCFTSFFQLCSKHRFINGFFLFTFCQFRQRWWGILLRQFLLSCFLPSIFLVSAFLLKCLKLCTATFSFGHAVIEVFARLLQFGQRKRCIDIFRA